MISRRTLLVGASATLAAAALARKTGVAATYRGASVIDGNLGYARLFDGQPVTASEAARIRASGLTAFKQTIGEAGLNFADTEHELALVKAAIARTPGFFTLVERFEQIEEAKRLGKLGVILSFEAATMLEGRLAAIDHFAAQGVRIMGLSYNLNSPFGAGTLQPVGGGLTALGRQAVARMGAQGVTVDLSHSNDLTGLQAASAARVPVLITHAGCAAVHPHPRNKSDRLLRTVAERGGAIGIFELSYLGDYPAYPTLATFMRHVSHALTVCGEDHVGIGSDTDLLNEDMSKAATATADRVEATRRAQGIAAPEELPFHVVRGLNGPNRWQRIADELARRGYGSHIVDKVLGVNFARVLRETWTVPRAGIRG